MLDPTRQRMLLIQQSQYPPIERLAEPYLKTEYGQYLLRIGMIA